MKDFGPHTQFWLCLRPVERPSDAFWGRLDTGQIVFCRICRRFVEGVRGVLGVFRGCLGEFLSMYEDCMAKFAILAVLKACWKAF